MYPSPPVTNPLASNPVPSTCPSSLASVKPASTASEQPSPSLSVSKWSGVPSPSVSVVVQVPITAESPNPSRVPPLFAEKLKFVTPSNVMFQSVLVLVITALISKSRGEL